MRSSSAARLTQAFAGIQVDAIGKYALYALGLATSPVTLAAVRAGVAARFVSLDVPPSWPPLQRAIGKAASWKNACTSASSRVRGIGGRLARNRRP